MVDPVEEEEEEEESTQFGSSTPFAEPPWYNSKNATPYYNEHHIKWRNKIRQFVEDEIIPFCDEWEEVGEIPGEVYKRAGEVGVKPKKKMSRFNAATIHTLCVVQ